MLASKPSDWDALPEEFVLSNASIVLDENLNVVESGFVHVRAGTIVAAGPGIGPTGVPELPLPGHLILPGLINCHTHLGDAVAKELGFGASPRVNLLWQPDGLRHQYMQRVGRRRRVDAMHRALRLALNSGTVALADFREGGEEGVRELREAARTLALRCLAIGRFDSFPLHQQNELDANTTLLGEDRRRELEAVLADADGFSPLWANDTTDPGMRQIDAWTRARGKLVATHAGETDVYRQLSIARTGESDVSRLAEYLHPDFVVHMTNATPEELDTIAAHGIPVVICPRTQAALGYGIVPYPAMQQRGILVGLGTDNAMISSPDLLLELQFLARALRASAGAPDVVQPKDMLALVTINAARILKVDQQLGSISPGKAAALLVLNMGTDNLADSVDPLASAVNRATAADISAVLVDGRVAYRRPRPLPADDGWSQDG